MEVQQVNQSLYGLSIHALKVCTFTCELCKDIVCASDAKYDMSPLYVVQMPSCYVNFFILSKVWFAHHVLMYHVMYDNDFSVTILTVQPFSWLWVQLYMNICNVSTIFWEFWFSVCKPKRMNHINWKIELKPNFIVGPFDVLLD